MQEIPRTARLKEDHREECFLIPYEGKSRALHSTWKCGNGLHRQSTWKRDPGFRLRFWLYVYGAKRYHSDDGYRVEPCNLVTHELKHITPANCGNQRCLIDNRSAEYDLELWVASRMARPHVHDLTQLRLKAIVFPTSLNLWQSQSLQIFASISQLSSSQTLSAQGVSRIEIIYYRKTGILHHARTCDSVVAKPVPVSVAVFVQRSSDREKLFCPIKPKTATYTVDFTRNFRCQYAMCQWEVRDPGPERSERIPSQIRRIRLQPSGMTRKVNAKTHEIYSHLNRSWNATFSGHAGSTQSSRNTFLREIFTVLLLI
jgi:hypothetical protein